MSLARRTVRTPFTVKDAAAVTARAWHNMLAEDAPPSALAVAVAQECVETGYGQESFNHSCGNEKCGADVLHCFRFAGENIERAEADRLVKAWPGVVRIARTYTNAFGDAMAAIEITPPDDAHESSEWQRSEVAEWCRFRAYSSLEEGVARHLSLLRARYGHAWPALAKGDVEAFTWALKGIDPVTGKRFAYGYFTAEVLGPKGYLTAMVGALANVRRALAPVESTPMPAVPPALAALQEIFTPRVGETVEDWAARAVRSLAGAKPEPDGILYHLAAKVEKRAAQEMYRATNCATTMRWILAWLECPHPWCYLPDEVLRALDGAGPVSWLRKIAFDLGAVVDVRKLTPVQLLLLLREGWPMRYNTAGTNDDHVEWCTDERPSDPEPDEHVGGGRAGNRITLEVGDLTRSMGRPVVEVFDIRKLLPNFKPVEAPPPLVAVPEVVAGAFPSPPIVATEVDLPPIEVAGLPLTAHAVATADDKAAMRATAIVVGGVLALATVVATWFDAC